MESHWIPPNDPAQKVRVIRAGVEGPVVLLEFVGRRGIFRKVLEDGSLSNPAPFALDILPDTNTDPVPCDIISNSGGKRRNVLLLASMKVEGDKLHLATAGSLLPEDRPKEFKAYRDDRFYVNYDIFERVRPRGLLRGLDFWLERIERSISVSREDAGD